MKPYAPSLAWNKPAVVTRVCYLRVQKVESEESGVQGHPWVHSKFNANLGNMKPYLKQNQNFKI